MKPYDAIKEKLAEARARYRELVDEFVNELRSRCDVMNEKQKRALVLELLAQDTQAGLDAAAAEKRQGVSSFLENLWDKYASPLDRIAASRDATSKALGNALKKLGYVR